MSGYIETVLRSETMIFVSRGSGKGGGPELISDDSAYMTNNNT